MPLNYQLQTRVQPSEMFEDTKEGNQRPQEVIVRLVVIGEIVYHPRLTFSP